MSDPAAKLPDRDYRGIDAPQRIGVSDMLSWADHNKAQVLFRLAKDGHCTGGQLCRCDASALSVLCRDAINDVANALAGTVEEEAPYGADGTVEQRLREIGNDFVTVLLNDQAIDTIDSWVNHTRCRVLAVFGPLAQVPWELVYIAGRSRDYFLGDKIRIVRPGIWNQNDQQLHMAEATHLSATSARCLIHPDIWNAFEFMDDPHPASWLGATCEMLLTKQQICKPARDGESGICIAVLAHGLMEESEATHGVGALEIARGVRLRTQDLRIYRVPPYSLVSLLACNLCPGRSFALAVVEEWQSTVLSSWAPIPLREGPRLLKELLQAIARANGNQLHILEVCEHFVRAAGALGRLFVLDGEWDCIIVAAEGE